MLVGVKKSPEIALKTIGFSADILPYVKVKFTITGHEGPEIE